MTIDFPCKRRSAAGPIQQAVQVATLCVYQRNWRTKLQNGEYVDLFDGHRWIPAMKVESSFGLRFQLIGLIQKSSLDSVFKCIAVDHSLWRKIALPGSMTRREVALCGDCFCAFWGPLHREGFRSEKSGVVPRKMLQWSQRSALTIFPGRPEQVQHWRKSCAAFSNRVCGGS